MKGNLAARAGHWSAHNRKKAIWGWIACVLLATVLGGMVGTKTIPIEDYGNGESRKADQAIAAADFPDDAGESVLIQGRGQVRADSPEIEAAVTDLVARLERV